MRVLVVKLSSMGDVVNTLPALTDAAKKIEDIQFDWVVEKPFCEVPSWHGAVSDVIAVEIRKWRQNWRKSLANRQVQQAISHIRERRYDCVIDAQGLFKSMLISKMARGPVAGYDEASSRARYISRFYRQQYTVPKGLHAIERTRSLFAQALGYDMQSTLPDYGVGDHFIADLKEPPYMMFLHGTTWVNKQWPEVYWQDLAKIVTSAGFKVKICSGNPVEKERATRIAHAVCGVEVLDRISLQALGQKMAGASGIVSVDTGLGHLAAALNRPLVSLYGPTDPGLVGAVGAHQKTLQSDFKCAPCLKRHCTYAGLDRPVEPPCFAKLTPKVVWQQLRSQLHHKS